MTSIRANSPKRHMPLVPTHDYYAEVLSQQAGSPRAKSTHYISIAQVIMDMDDKYDDQLQQVRAIQEKHVKKWRSKSKTPTELRQLINTYHSAEKRIMREKEKATQKAVNDFETMLADSNKQAAHALSGTPLKDIKKAYTSRIHTLERKKAYGKTRRAMRKKSQ